MAFGYRVPDLPRKGAGAFLPPLVQHAEVSSWGLVHVSGAPGTMAVASPKPSTTNIRAGALGQAVEPRTMPSWCSPDVILPAIYVASVRNMGPQQGALGVRVRSTNDVPVPAINIVRSAAVTQAAPPKLGGRKVTPWPRAFQRWPSVTSGKGW